MNADSTFIPATSQRQALDWNLVLISQDIPSILVHRDEDDRWGLTVDPRDLDRALAAIRQYQRENRGWSWRQELPWTGIVFHWGALFWCALLVFFYVLEEVRGIPLRADGLMDSAAILSGQWWRLFTAITLHADVGHLAANATIGFLLLGLAMARFGPGWGLLASFLTGVGGNLLGLILYPLPHRSLGSSGMVLGALGLVGVQSASLWRESPHGARYFISGLLAGLMLFILLGLDPKADLVAHLGGFLCGGLFGAVLAWLPMSFLQSPRSNLVASLLLSFLVLYPWWLALNS
ncbi:MAG: rhomboid family intramembrane serine protease [Candidatus Omnitrophica bacterium]|nr:rhomboid family intramembrane serine protease [Candidatus Omnitrophota bacterium]